MRRGYRRAIVATAHKMLRVIFAILRDGTPYRDPVTDYEAMLVKRNAPRWSRLLRAIMVCCNVGGRDDAYPLRLSQARP